MNKLLSILLLVVLCSVFAVGFRDAITPAVTPTFGSSGTSSGNFSAPGVCPTGYVVQNTTIFGVDCVSVAALSNVSIYSGDNGTYITGGDTIHINFSTFDANYLRQDSGYNTTTQLQSIFLNWSYYTQNISQYYLASNPREFINASGVVDAVGNFSAENSTLARIGSCSPGYVVQNTTLGGVECVLMSSSSGGINESFANETYARLDGNNQPFTGNISAPKISPSNQSWGSCWNGTDYVTGYLVGVNCV